MNGYSWTQISDFSGMSTFSVEWTGSKWLLATYNGSNTILYTSTNINGANSSWTTGITLYTGSNYVNCLVYNGYITVLGGNTSSTIQYSSDNGTTFNSSTSGNTVFSTGCYSVSWNGSMWVGVGSGTYSIGYSYDGINWNGVSSSTSIFSTGISIKWNGLRWIASGFGGSNSFAYSSNGINWIGSANIYSSGLSATTLIPLPNTSQLVGPTGVQGFTGPQGLTGYTGPQGAGGTGPTGSIAISNQFMIGGGTGTNVLSYSLNGTKWLPTNGNVMDTCNAVCYNGNIFVAGGGINGSDNQQLLYSFNGITWYQSGTSAGGVLSIAWNGSIFVVAGLNSNCRLYSYTGTSWSLATIPQLDNSSTAVIWLNNQWLMIGSGNATPSYITAQVGISDWSSRRDLPLGSVFGNCLGYNGSLVLVGFKNGAIQNASNTNIG